MAAEEEDAHMQSNPATLRESEEDSDRMGVRMNVLQKIIEDLNERLELREIFGSDVGTHLVLVADESDLRIEDAGDIDLTEQQREVFLEILGEVIRANAD